LFYGPLNDNSKGLDSFSLEPAGTHPPQSVDDKHSVDHTYLIYPIFAETCRSAEQFSWAQYLAKFIWKQNIAIFLC
jgi:hypothetical protein